MKEVAAATRCEIVVPVYNGHDALARCLAALGRHTPAHLRVWLVDDASSDARILPLLRAFAAGRPGTVLLENPSNLGFVGSVNAALARIDDDAVLLNADAEVTPGWIEGLLRCRASAPGIGIVCPLSNNATLLSLPALEPLFEPGDREAIAACVADAGAPVYPRIPTAVGFCMLVTRELLRAAGPLDPAYGRGYGEENDLSMRALDLGFEIACCDDVYVHHGGGASFGEVEALDAARERNRQLLERRWPAYGSGVSGWMRANPLRPTVERINARCERERLPGRPRVLHVMHRFDTHGGVEQHTRAIIEELKRDVAFNVLVPHPFSTGWGDLQQERAAPHLRVSRLNRDLFSSGVHVLEYRASVRDAAIERAFAQFMAGGYDVVHFHSPLSLNSLHLPHLARQAGARVVLGMHDMGWMCADYNMVWRDGRPCGRAAARAADAGCIECLRGKSFSTGGPAAGGIADFIEERFAAACSAIAAADAIACPSQFMARRVAAAFGAEAAGKTRVIEHGVHQLPRIYRGSDRPVLTVAYVGRFSPQKGGHHFLELARVLEGERIVLEAWGQVDERIREAARATGVVLHGDYAVPDLADHLRAVDLVIIPTPLEESFCLTLSEVQALGIPVAAARSGAIPERIRDGENGFLFDAGDIAAMRRLLLQLRDDRRPLARAAAALAAERPRTIAEDAAEHLGLYRGLMASAATPRARAAPEIGRLPRVPRQRRRTPLGADDYDRWLASEEAPLPEAARPKPIAVVLLPAAGEPPLQPRALNQAIAECATEWVAIAQDGDKLSDDALAVLAEECRRHPAAALIYCDEDAMSARGERYDPLFKPRFGPELLRHRPYIAGLCAIHRGRWLAMGGARAEGWLGVVELALRLAEQDDPRLVGHARGVLVHRLDINLAQLDTTEFRRRMGEVVAEGLRRAGAQPMRLAAAGGAPAMWAHRAPGAAPISVCLRSGGNARDAAACLEALAKGTTASRIGEVIVDVPVEQAGELVAVLRGQGCNAPVRAQKTRGGEALAEAFQHANGEWVAVVDARCRGFTPGWLERLEQGIAGAFTAGLAPDLLGAAGERVAGGYVLGGGPWSVAGPSPAALGNNALASLYGSPREVSCISPFLSLWRREAVNAPGVAARLREAGRFDVAHLGLELRGRGFDLVARPFVAAQCPAARELPTRSSSAETEVPADVAWMRSRWGEALDDDPCFHPSLWLSSPRLALSPRFAAKRREGAVRVCAFPFDRWGSGEMRVRQPCAALERAALAEVAMMDTHESGWAPNRIEWRRLGADTLLAHNFFHDYQLVALDECAREGKTLRVLGMDDLLTGLPPGNPYAATIYPDIAERIARAVARCDRLVVSTPQLADAYGRGIEVHVIPNALDAEVWAGLANRNRRGERARIGWAGARQHLDDLALLERVVAVTHGEIDWVFLGMCPPALRRYAAEFHDMVPVADYPAKLASLGLDAAAAPLVDHAFNRAKSDLKVTEYGILGIPVVASNVGAYRETPAILVDGADAWIDAVRALAGDRDAAAARGETLRNWVLTNRMLPQMLPRWCNALNGPPPCGPA